MTSHVTHDSELHEKVSQRLTRDREIERETESWATCMREVKKELDQGGGSENRERDGAEEQHRCGERW